MTYSCRLRSCLDLYVVQRWPLIQVESTLEIIYFNYDENLIKIYVTWHCCLDLCGEKNKYVYYATVMTGDRLSSSDESEQDVLRSELWTTLFRGGYMVGTAKLQRTLSGKFVRVYIYF